MSDHGDNIQRAIGAFGRRLDEQAERLKTLRDFLAGLERLPKSHQELAEMVEALGGRLTDVIERLAPIERDRARALEIHPDDILGAAAIVMAERRIALDDIADDLIAGAGAEGAARHMGGIQHAIVEAVKRGVALAQRRQGGP